MKPFLVAVAALCVAACGLPAQTPLVDLKTAAFEGAETTEAGVKFSLKLPTKRSNWTAADWKICRLAGPAKLPGNAMRIAVSTEKPRGDVGVYIALGEADGSWYCHPWSANLTQARNVGTVRLKDFSPCEWTAPVGGKFSDENGQLDPDQIAMVAIGTINPMGVGQVEFTLTELSVVQVKEPTPAPVQVAVTGKLLEVNGTQYLPAGVFGSFNLGTMDLEGQKVRRAEHYRLASDRNIHGGAGPTPITHMVIHVAGGDRGMASPRLTNPKWEAEATAQGTRYGEQAKNSGKTVYVEYYNEPYLNWANKNRRSFNPGHFDQSKATEGGPVHIKHDGIEVPFLRWTQNYDAPLYNWTSRRDWRRGKDENGRVYSDWAEPTPWGRKGSAWAPHTHPPENVKDGETYTIKVGKKGQEKELTLTAFTPWHVYDQTQHTYWSARGLALFYNDPMIAVGKALKTAGGDKTVYIAGWGFRPSEDHWAGFEKAYKATIDAGIPYIDGVNDHDYGGDPTKMSANYEVICAYGLTTHNKWLYGYNTECSGAFDPEAYGAAAAAAAGSPELAGARWVTAKILHALEYVPDKARNFAHFGGGNFFRDQGEGVALTALMNLRGRLLQVQHDDPEVYVAAAIDGTDPLNPRPAKLGEGQELVLAAYNAAPQAREINLAVTAPRGTQLGSPVIRVMKSVAGKPAIVETKQTKLALGSGELVVASYPLSGELAQAQTAKRQQTFAKLILQEATPAQPLQAQIPTPLPANRAWVQFVAERLAEGEATVTINGNTLPLPACITPENSPWIRRFPIDPKLLKPTNEISVQIADKSQAGFLLGSLSLIVEQD